MCIGDRSNTPKMIFISHLQPLQISNKEKFHAFFEKFSHWKLKPDPNQDKFLDFLQNEFSHSKYFQKAFFHLNGGAWPSGHAQAQSACHPFKWKKMLFGNILSMKIYFVKSQRIFLESGLVSALNGWTSEKMHEILLCLIFEAVVDVIWKSILVCLITWMLNFFQIKYFAIVCSLKAKRQGFYFFENFRELKNMDFFLQALKAKKQSFYFFANLES